MNHPHSLLWEPSAARIDAARVSDYRRWLAVEFGVRCDDYGALWNWSVTEPDAFWRSLWMYFGVKGYGKAAPALAHAAMPNSTWFPEASLNYAEQVFSQASDARPAIIAGDESGALESMAWPELKRQVAALAHALRLQGVQAGDRVAAYLPNRAEAVVAFLAVASIGAIWSLCAPDMGSASVLERWRQIKPKVLITASSYTFGGQNHDRHAEVNTILAALPSVQLLITVGPHSSLQSSIATLDWDWATQGDFPLTFERVPFAHPLWIVYSSGTTGLPKPIVHGHGGIVLEHLKLHGLHNDLGPQDRLLWHSSTGWIMWNVLVGALLVGATICLYDGSPAWPNLDAIWAFADRAEATFVGAGAAFFQSCKKAGVVPRPQGRLTLLRSIGSTGSPLASDTYEWLQAQLGSNVWINPISGGTDIASAFVGGICTLPVYAGVMQCRCLGASVEAWDESGRPVIDQVGELVCTLPMPSMPIGFWNDSEGRRLFESYFDHFPGVWRHGDWVEITSDGGAVVYGRSDATINRHGIRMGTSELYGAVEALPEITDALVVDLEYLGRESYMPLFVVLEAGHVLDDALKGRLVAAIRQALTPKHVPNDIFQVAQVPRTLTGKKLEVPVKRLMLGEPAQRVINLDAMANPSSVQWFIDFAARRLS